jgi:photoactive yellow protein
MTAITKNAADKLRREKSMANAGIDFNAPDLAARIEKLGPSAIDRLPFGVIRVDREGTVLVYSATEARLSGYGTTPLGRNLFDVSLCATRDDFRERVMHAIESGAADLELGWRGDASDPNREMRIRIQSYQRPWLLTHFGIPKSEKV